MPDTMRLTSESVHIILSINFFFYMVQAKKHNVATYIVGIVIGVAPLSMTVLSSLIGYFVS